MSDDESTVTRGKRERHGFRKILIQLKRGCVRLRMCRIVGGVMLAYKREAVTRPPAF